MSSLFRYLLVFLHLAFILLVCNYIDSEVTYRSRITVSGIVVNAFIVTPPFARGQKVRQYDTLPSFNFGINTQGSNLSLPLNCTTDESIFFPPIAKREDNRFVTFGRQSPLAIPSKSVRDDEWLDPPVLVSDPYGWMRWKDDSTLNEKQQILDHIARENNYTSQYFHSENGRRGKLQKQLLQEFQFLHETKAGEAGEHNNALSIDSGQISDLYSRHGYYFYTRRPSNQPYALHCRGNAAFSQPLQNKLSEEVLLDENLLVKYFRNISGGEYFAIHTVVPILSSSPTSNNDQNNNQNASLLGVAFSVDLLGDESYTIYLQPFPVDDGSLDTSLFRVAEHTSGSIEYVLSSTDHDTFSLHYVAMDIDLQRPYQWVEWRCKDNSHTIVHTEYNEQYWGNLRQTSDGQYLLWSTETSSVLGSVVALDITSPFNEPMTIRLEFPNFILDHRIDHWWVLVLNGAGSNSFAPYDTSAIVDGGKCWNQLYTSSRNDVSQLKMVDWPLQGDTNTNIADIYLDDVKTFSDHVILQGRQDGLRRMWVLTLNQENEITDTRKLFPSNDEPAHYINMARKQDYNSKLCFLTYESMVTPPQILQVNLTNMEFLVIYEQFVHGYSKSDFCCCRMQVPSRDGITSISVSMVYHKDVEFPCPLHLLGYGAYGHSLEPSFSTIRLPMLNRGMACAVAHVRGGGEQGKRWHENGRGSLKENSINDFVDVAACLIENNITRPSVLAAEGRSAGGLLVAAAMNQRPDLFRSIVLGVPFLDILCTMADSTLPLTAVEWEEWGNPHTHDAFHTIRDYCPMYNIVTDKVYPSCLLIGGRHDPRVPFWEPLKFAAALRHSTGPKRQVLVKIQTNAGHSFGSNRTKYFEEISFLYAFIIDEIATSKHKV